MPPKIKPKRSYTANAVPTTSDLDANELAINWADGKAYTKNAAGNIVSVTLGGGGGGSANIVEAATTAGFPATGASGTLYIATDASRVYRWTGSVYVEIGTSGGGAGGDGTDSVLRALFVPGAPTSVTVAAGNAQATVSWTAPAGVIAAAPVTDYVVQFSSNSGSTWTTFSDGTSTSATATVTGLTNGTAYVFRVAAVNGVGTGAYTTASSSVTPTAGTPPNAPTSLTATAGNAQLSLAWTAPSAPGTSAISGYTVEYTPSGGSAQTVSTGSTGTSYTLTGLTNGTAYTVRVAGVSAAGTGTYSTSVSGTPAAALSAPVLTLASCNGDGIVSFSWTAVAGATTYRLQTNNNRNTGVAFSDDRQLSASLTWTGDVGLNDFGLGWFRVRAENATQQSPFSNLVQANCGYAG
jgi:hypothetical protein